ncbi:MAG: hypothetical protein GWN87_21835, partial [Desulfuromonadales bacterium]|nr:hypothetical protein [Desulfuromonadales bacterium]NIS42583.1 hypothetical protein [Desulfuromonadales bacterium]
LSRLVAVADNRHQGRLSTDQEFTWLMNDIQDYNRHAEETEISLLESVGRQKMEEAKEKKAKRKAQSASGAPL